MGGRDHLRPGDPHVQILLSSIRKSNGKISKFSSHIVKRVFFYKTLKKFKNQIFKFKTKEDKL